MMSALAHARQLAERPLDGRQLGDALLQILGPQGQRVAVRGVREPWCRPSAESFFADRDAAAFALPTCQRVERDVGDEVGRARRELIRGRASRFE
jgi:hypothetical protein